MKKLKERKNITSLFILSIIISFALLCITANQITSFAQGDESVSISGVPCETQTLYAIAENTSGNLTYQWQYSDTIDGTYTNISGATSDSYELPSITYNGRYIKVIATDSNGSYEQAVGPVGNFIEFDLAKGVVNLAGTYTGYSADYVTGNADVTGTHQTNNVYYVTQTNPSQATSNNIVFGGKELTFNLTINNINSSVVGNSGVPDGGIIINATNNKKYVTIRLRGNNYLKQLFYATGEGSHPNSYANNDSTLKITSDMGDGSTEGVLNINNSVPWSAGIGGIDATTYEGSTGITIAGGALNITSQRSAAIGGGGNGYSEITITGGIVNATSAGTGATIGGGGGDSLTGGQGNITITGGIVNATNHGSGNYTGVAIGGASSRESQGSLGTVTITGGTINAIGGIGGGGSNTKIGGDANVTITGGTIKTNSIGGGFSQTYGYRNANVTITGGSINSSIAGTPTNGTEQVYLTRATLYEADQLKTNYVITSLNGHSTYGMNDVKTNEQGNLYLWLPKDIEITGAVNGNTFTGSIPTSYSGVLKYNCSQYYYAVNMGISDRFKVYSDSEYNNALDGSITVPSSTSLSLYLLKNDAYSSMTVNAYKSSQNETMEEISGFSSNNIANFIVNGDTMVWFKTTYGGTSRLELDLTMGDIIIEEDTETLATNDFVISQNGHSLNGYVGEFYITTGGKATSNKIIVNSGNANIYLDKFIAESNESIIEVRDGTANLTYSLYDNQIISDNDSAIKVLDNGILNISSNTVANSLKLYGGTNKSAIGGTGEVNITKTDGFLVLTKGTGATSQIEAKNYTYTTNLNDGMLPYTLSLNPGTLVGYNRSSDNKLYLPSATQVVSETTSFTAFGITYYNLLNNVANGGASINVDGDYEIILTDAYTVDIRRKNVKLVENTDYTFDAATDKLTILNTDTYGNIIISATIQGTILYDAQPYSGIFDGTGHTISVELLEPNDATIKYGTSAGTYNLDDSPTYTDVGTHTIYYQISKNSYTTVIGSKTVTITKGTNEWKSTLLVNSVLEGTELNPIAVAKWGTPTYLYSLSYNGSYTSTKPTTVGSYYVKATVVGTGNYDTITGDAVKVVIEPFGIYMGVGRLFSQLDLGYKGITTTLPANDIYTMRYEFSYIPDTSNPLKLAFNKNLINGTRLTLTDFSEETPKYYYYNVTNSLNNLNLIQFKKMGANTFFAEKEEGIATSINYQINIDLPNGIGTGDFTTTFYKGSSVIPNTTTTAVLTQGYNPTGSVTIGAVSTASYNQIVIPITASATGTKHKVLSISLLDSNGDSLIFPIGTNVNMNSTEPSAIHGNIATFDLGTNNIDSEVYTINITGIEAGTYKIQANISEVDVSAISHPLGGSLDSKTSNTLTVNDLPSYGLKVTTMEGQTRNVKKGSNIDLKLTYNVSEHGSLSIKSVKKVDGNYNSAKTNETFKLSTTGTNFGTNINSYTTTTLNTSTDVNVRLTAPNESGTYRYFFYLGTTEIKYNIIVE